MFPFKSRFRDLAGEREKLVQRDLKGVNIQENNRGAGKEPIPINATGIQGYSGSRHDSACSEVIARYLRAFSEDENFDLFS